MIAFDLETNALSPYEGDILMYTFSDGVESWYYTDLTKECKYYLTNYTLVGHNISFDLKFLNHKGIYPKYIKDTFINELIINSGDRVGISLDNVLKKRLNIVINKDLQTSFQDIESADQLSQEQINYALNDVKYLLKLNSIQEDILSNLDMKHVQELENLLVPILSNIEYKGCRVDIDLLNEFDIEIKNQIVQHKHEFESKLLEYDLENCMIHMKKSSFPAVKDSVINFNTNYSIHLQQVFSYVLETQITSVNKNHIKKYDNHPLIKKYLNYINLFSTNIKFIEPLKKHIRNKRVHTKFFPILTTGRLSCSDPPMQQIPSNSKWAKLRKLFFGDYRYVITTDYSSIELRIVAEMSQEPNMINPLLNYEDLHSKTAIKIFSIEEGEVRNQFNENVTYRDVAKTINFGLIYGMTADKLAATLSISKELANQLLDGYFSEYNVLKKYLEKLGNFAERYGYSETLPPFKRKRFFKSPNTEEKIGKINRMGKNAPVQGTSADILKYALVLIHFNMPEKSQLLLNVHDEIVSSSDDINFKDFQESMMIKAAKKVLKTVPVEVETKIKKTWTK